MKQPGLWQMIRADLVAHDRFAIGPGWTPGGRGPGAWWWRYRRNHHAAGIMIVYRIREWAQSAAHTRARELNPQPLPRQSHALTLRPL